MRLADEKQRAPPAAAWSSPSAKTVALVALTIQNSALILVLYYSRQMPPPGPGPQRYFTSTTIFLSEILKLGICLSIALSDLSRTLSPSTPATTLFSTLFQHILTRDSWKLAIPATLYTLQNTLQFVAVQNLEAATMQVTYQFKILPTALFSVLILGRTLGVRRWIALGLLMVGVIVVQLPGIAGGDRAAVGTLQDAHSRTFFPRDLVRNAVGWQRSAATPALNKRSATYEGIEEDFLLSHPSTNPSLGLGAALAACTVAALASVYFEKVLKESHESTSIWVRNVQLSMYSLFPAFFIGVAFIDGEDISKHGFFAGYNSVVWAAVGLQAMGGILVALCVHLADTLVKSFATSISILVSLVASVWFFEFRLTGNFLVGTSIVIAATYLYSKPDFATSRPPPIQIHDYEKTTIDTEAARAKLLSTGIKTPAADLKGEAQSTSRPVTPLLHHSRSSSTLDYFAAKRND